jgi:hypothetical protein
MEHTLKVHASHTINPNKEYSINFEAPEDATMADSEPTYLHKLVYQCNWNGIIARLETHPAERLKLSTI